MSDEILLKVEHLCQYFRDNKAVDDVSFEIKKGEVFGLVGESGCGKTTTGRTIIKIYDATSGNVYFKGQRIVAGTLSYRREIASAYTDYKKAVAEIKADALPDKEKRIADEKAKRDAIISSARENIKSAKHDKKNCDSEYRKTALREAKQGLEKELAAASGEAEKNKIRNKYRGIVRKAKRYRLTTKIQMIFQDPIASLDPRMTVREIISEGLIIQGERDRKVIDQKVYEMLELVGLVREHADRYPHEFSGGQRQRIGVARSVIMNPDLIIADEPVSALDVSIQAQVINLLNDLRKELGLTILFIAHDLSVVKYFSDRIAVMYYGKLVETATSDELFEHPLHPYTKSLLSAIPLPDPNYEKNRKRIIYNPLADHDYSKEKPVLREIEPGHMILCNTEELEKYKKELGVNA